MSAQTFSEELATEPTPAILASGSNRQHASTHYFRSSSARSLPGKSRHTSILVDATREFSIIRRPEKSDIENYKELFYQFIDRIEKTDRRLISAMLARSAYAPRAVALYLAQDALEVAAPFLLFSPVLNDLDLRAIAAKKGKIYADVIKKRQLPMEPFTARKLDEALLEVSSSAPTLQIAEDTPADPSNSTSLPGDEIVALAGVGGRLGRKHAPSETPAFSETNDSDVNQSTPVSSGPDALRTFKLPKKEMRSLLKAARIQDHHAFAEIVEDLCGLESAATRKLLGAPSGNEALYLIKALGVPAPHDMQMALMAMPRIGRDMESYRTAKKTLGELDPGICRLIFNEIGARFDLSNRGKNKAQEQAPKIENSLKEAMQNRRRNVLDTYHTTHNRPVTGKLPNDLSGLAPMSRWPGAEAGLREAV